MPGVGLSEGGRAEAEQLARSLSLRPITAVVSSPLQRAQETAAPLASRLGMAVRIEPGLDEIDFGAWTGQGFADLEGQPEWHAWNRFRSAAACPSGETMLAAQARALQALTGLCSASPAGEIVVVSHQDVLKAVLAHLLGIPLDLFQRITLDPAHRSVVVLSGTEVRVDGVNLPPA